MSRRTIVIGLDAFEPTVGRRLIAEGRMPSLAKLVERGARFDLDHGRERYTGLAWHQFSTGLHPSQSGRWSAIRFDPQTYEVSQPDTEEPPFTCELGVDTIVFDVPRFDLTADAASIGIANWGCHDAGVPQATRPAELWQEVVEQFGEYPAPEHIYGIVWRDAAKTDLMGGALVEAIEKRRQIALWLLKERLPNWQLAILAISEFHSVIETMWHGWDNEHPLHGMPSADPARRALVAVYEAADRFLGAIAGAFPDAVIVAFAPHGMGANKADAMGMALMAELMFRYSLGLTALTDVGRSEKPDHEDWSTWVNSRLSFPAMAQPARPWYRAVFDGRPSSKELSFDHRLDWMPTARYRHFWPAMRAFALPAYHDARIRVNVAGREAKGVVHAKDYARTVEEIGRLVRSCMDSAARRPIAAEVEATHPTDPFAVGDWEADIVVRIDRNTLGLFHPAVGEIGPVPHRRTGGHTGGYGAAYVAGAGIDAMDGGVVSTFDVVPTIGDLVTGRVPRSKLGQRLGLGGGVVVAGC